MVILSQVLRIYLENVLQRREQIRERAKLFSNLKNKNQSFQLFTERLFSKTAVRKSSTRLLPLDVQNAAKNMKDLEQSQIQSGDESNIWLQRKLPLCHLDFCQEQLFGGAL